MREPSSPKVLTADQVANLGQQAQNVITAQRKSPTIPGAWLHVADLVATVEFLTARLDAAYAVIRKVLDGPGQPLTPDECDAMRTATEEQQ